VRLGGLVQLTDPEKVARRDRDMAMNPQLMASITPRLGAGLHGDAVGPAGTLAPQPRLRDGRLMDDAVGQRFAVITATSLWNEMTLEDLDGLDDSVLAVLPGEGQDWLRDLDASAIVVRPDRYVLGSARTPAELRSLLARIPHHADTEA